MLAISMASHSGRTLPALLLVFLLSCASADVALGQPLGLVHSDDGLDYLAAPMQVGHSLPDVNLHKASSLVVGAVVAALALLLIAIAIVFINLRKRWRVLLLGTIAVLLIMLEAWLEHYISYRYEEDGRAQVARRLSLVRANLETILNNNLSLIKGMGIAISANPTLSQEQFNHYAKETLRTETLLINLVAAPDLIVSFAYPEAHKRALDGLDYRTRPEQYGDIKRIQKMRRMIVAGPVNLVQGGQGFIGRAPIYYTDPGTGTEQFWGIISSVMELEAVYEAAGVLELAQQQQIAIRKHSAETGLQPVFFGDEKVFDGNPVITEMRIGAESWHLASSLKGEPHGLAMAINGLRLLFVLVTLVSILIMQIRQRQQRERQALMDALSYREGVLAQVGRIANVGGWEYKVGQGFLYWSPEVYRILNVAPNKGPLSRRELNSMIDPESRKVISSAFQGVFEKGEDINAELLINICGGGQIWVEVQSHSQLDDHGVWHLKGALQDITERKKSELTILRQANYDPLTQLPNRNYFDSQLAAAVASAQRSGELFALLFIDLDRFKSVNDSLGHSTGDVLLQRVAERLGHCVRESDVLSRRSGDEFTLIATQLHDPKSAELIAQKIIDQLKLPIAIDGNQIYASASIGITVFPYDAQNVEGLLKNADQAMYAAKDMGRNRFRYFTAEMQSDSDQRLQLHMDLVKAIENGLFKVHYQPIVDIESGAIIDCEALLRWPHPQLGEISPARFIPLAEDVGLISRLGQIAMDTALADIKALNRRCQTDIGVSLNKSYREFFGAIEDDERWLQNLAKAQGNTQVIIEITESMLMEDDSVYSYLAQLRQSGIKIAIDDFGTGYSSLSYLRRFPVDWLKIDRSFVSDIVLNEEDLSLVESIIAMAHKLKLKVVAEGVETEQQWLLLKQLGCDMAQGFYFARPMPIDKLEAYMQGHAQPGGPQIEPAL